MLLTNLYAANQTPMQQMMLQQQRMRHQVYGAPPNRYAAD
jgi:hypothetical protein